MFVNTLKPTFLVGYCFMRRKLIYFVKYKTIIMRIAGLFAEER